MRILLTSRALGVPGGSETYVETVAPQLAQLGHEVVVHSPVRGIVADRLRRAGIFVRRDLPTTAPDVIHAQHSSGALRARGHFPATPMVYVCHSSVLDIEDPPRAADPQVVVTLSEVVSRRVAASAVGESARLVRLRQPVTVPFVDPARRALPSVPRTAVLSGDRVGSARAGIEEACERAGIALTVLGDGGHRPDDPIPAMMEADIVFGVGRTLLEAMALGRTCFMADDRGAWGFVTERNYDDAEAHAFARLTDRPVGSLADLLDAYRPALGARLSELARRHHSARLHARDLVEIYRGARDGAPPCRLDPAAVHEGFADAEEHRHRLDAARRQAEWRAAELAHELASTRAALEDREVRLRELTEALAATEAERSALQATRVMRWSRPARSLYARARVGGGLRDHAEAGTAIRSDEG